MKPEPASILLVAPQNLAYLSALVSQMTGMGHTVTPAHSPAEALALARARPFDLILLDATAPRSDPLALLRRVAQDPGGPPTAPVIVIVRGDDAATLDEAARLGAADYLATPLNPAAVRVRLAAGLHRARLQAALAGAKDAGDQFVSTVSHDLKTPMTSIKGYTDLLLGGAGGPVTETQAGFLEIIRENVERMAAFVSDLSDLVRAEAGRIFLQFERVSLAGVAQEAAESVRAAVEAKKQTLTLHIPPDLPPLWADPLRVRQILDKLVGNAHLYTPPNGTITLSARRASGAVCITVRDTGLGIDPREQPFVFDKFFRSKDDAVRRELGAGLGLSLAKCLAEVQGGRIRFKSAPGEGSAFYVTLPIADQTAAPAGTVSPDR